MSWRFLAGAGLGPPGSGGSGSSSTWSTGSGVPSNSFGNDGDLYIDTSGDKVYVKNSGAWMEQYDLCSAICGILTPDLYQVGLPGGFTLDYPGSGCT